MSDLIQFLLFATHSSLLDTLSFTLFLHTTSSPTTHSLLVSYTLYTPLFTPHSFKSGFWQIPGFYILWELPLFTLLSLHSFDDIHHPTLITPTLISIWSQKLAGDLEPHTHYSTFTTLDIHSYIHYLTFITLHYSTFIFQRSLPNTLLGQVAGNFLTFTFSICWIIQQTTLFTPHSLNRF